MNLADSLVAVNFKDLPKEGFTFKDVDGKDLTAAFTDSRDSYRIGAWFRNSDFTRVEISSLKYTAKGDVKLTSNYDFPVKIELSTGQDMAITNWEADKEKGTSVKNKIEKEFSGSHDRQIEWAGKGQKGKKGKEKLKSFEQKRGKDGNLESVQYVFVHKKGTSGDEFKFVINKHPQITEGIQGFVNWEFASDPPGELDGPNFSEIYEAIKEAKDKNEPTIVPLNLLKFAAYFYERIDVKSVKLLTWSDPENKDSDPIVKELEVQNAACVDCYGITITAQLKDSEIDTFWYTFERKIGQPEKHNQLSQQGFKDLQAALGRAVKNLTSQNLEEKKLCYFHERVYNNDWPRKQQKETLHLTIFVKMNMMKWNRSNWKVRSVDRDTMFAK